ncbi:MAG: hypothetical protein BWY04_01529 [candidate division CPR1 bacterium ADurb.Bin160]|uniref:Uncharacterized protein n=1 Tax=candidate division CPR1 bacterium ADurb.Bin160 TaxID=1852826 RepID=A0A1V5ZHR8_9BACT|nr:MAG: hypothetical protein BWY04_01529 [candidate division CPR1 bacterium ADurb.Bin160]
MEDKLEKRYRNISGTILIFNDLNYLEIGINEVIDLSLFSDDFLNKSRGLREQIALKNLVPDTSDVNAKQIDEKTFRMDRMFGEDFIKQIAKEVKDNIINEHNNTNSDLIKSIAAEIGKEISKNISSQTENSLKPNITDNNKYEQNIIDSSINKMQEALEKKYPEIQHSTSLIPETKIDQDEDYIFDLKDILKKQGENKNG